MHATWSSRVCVCVRARVCVHTSNCYYFIKQRAKEKKKRVKRLFPPVNQRRDVTCINDTNSAASSGVERGDRQE